MSTLQAILTTGGHTVLEDAVVSQLRASLRGAMLLPGDDEYDETRKVWNGMVDKRPALIARVLRGVRVQARQGSLTTMVFGSATAAPGSQTAQPTDIHPALSAGLARAAGCGADDRHR